MHAEQLGRRFHELPTVGRSLVYTAWCAMAAGDTSTSDLAATSALSLLSALDDQPGIALAQEALGFSRLLQGDDDTAETHLRAAETICRAHGELWLLSYVTYSLGIAAVRRGDTTASLGRARESLQLKRAVDDRVGAHRVLELFVILLAARGQDAKAATVLGAAITNTRLVGTRITAWTDESLSYAESTIREHLGPRFDAAYAAGASMAMPDVIELLSGDRASREGHDPVIAPSTFGLSRREIEVAQLVSEGLTNKEIGGRLFLSDRTVESHVRNILDKLGARSRVQIPGLIAQRD